MLTKTKLPPEVMLQKKLHYIAGNLRDRQTRAEELLWKFLRSRKFLGLKFVRQHPIDRFIVDFVCYEKKLVIEVDGEIHKHYQERDQNRDKILAYYGFQVLRFSNDDVTYKIQSVLKRIQACSLLPCKGGESERRDRMGVHIV